MSKEYLLNDYSLLVRVLQGMHPAVKNQDEELVRMEKVVEGLGEGQGSGVSLLVKLDVREVLFVTVEFFDDTCGREGLTMKLAGSSRSHFILGDPFKLRQIFLILLSLAKDGLAGCSSGLIQVEISEMSEKVMIKAMCTRMTTSSCTTGNPRSGLGLAIIRTLVTAMNGEIEVDSTWGIDTRISVTFPRYAESGRGIE